MTLLRRFLAAVTPTRPGDDLPHIPRPGDDIEQWLIRERDQRGDVHAVDPEWLVIDDLVRRYQRHAATSTPLNQPTCACSPADCAGCGPAEPF